MTRSEDIKKEQERVRLEVSKAIKSAMKAQRVSVYQLAKDSDLFDEEIEEEEPDKETPPTEIIEVKATEVDSTKLEDKKNE